jgi:hypothetical protein
MAFVAYEFKLKAGFFKTELYDLSICSDEIKLMPKENTALQEIIITNENLNSINLVKKSTNSFEIEINTQQGIFTGMLSKSINLEELISTLIKNFEGKIFI